MIEKATGVDINGDGKVGGKKDKKDKLQAGMPMQPGMMHPGMPMQGGAMMQPGMMQPGMMMQPGTMMQPGMMQPGMMQTPGGQSSLAPLVPWCQNSSGTR